MKSRYRFQLATDADEPALRRVLAETPIAGHLTLGFRREPDFFAAAAVHGRNRQFLVARDPDTQVVVGCASRSLRDVSLNGLPETVGYLGNLRILASLRHRGLLSEGIRFLHELHADGQARLYLAVISTENHAALDSFTNDHKGTPHFHSLGDFVTSVLPLASWRRPRESVPDNLVIRTAEETDLPVVLDFLARTGPGRQFFPRYAPADFRDGGSLRDLRREDVMLAYRDRALVGTLAAWDQHPFRQTIVESYDVPSSGLRLLYNLQAFFRGGAALPAAGHELRHIVAALPVVADDDPQVFSALLRRLLTHAARGTAVCVLLGLHAAHSLLPSVRRFGGWRHTNRLFVACWEDGREQLARLDGRVPYLELGSL